MPEKAPASAGNGVPPGNPDYHHVPVMMDEVLSYLDCRPGGTYVDCTLGGSGHARAVLEQIGPGGRLIGIDRDTAALRNAETILRPYARQIHLFHGNFIRLPEFLDQRGIQGVDGILADLGLSLYQIQASGRGFSFQKEEPLDMRMNPSADVTAGDLIHGLSEEELADIFRRYGEERWSRRIARRIVQVRKSEAFTSARLARLIEDAVPRPRPGTRHRIHPATRVFMALRIAVNRELENIETFMDMAPSLLNPGGRLCVLAFHSLEDRIVKHRLRALEKGCTCPPAFPQCVCGKKPVLRVLTRKAVQPSAAEVRQNPMARSTRLRAAEKRKPKKSYPGAE